MKAYYFIGNLFLVFYLWVTCSAFLVTVFRIPALPPYAIVEYSYGMMAPYQSPGTENQQLLIEGQKSDGTWEAIDLAPYYPVLFGERNVREFYAMYYHEEYPSEPFDVRSHYAQKLFELEKAKGHAYTALRFYWEQWPYKVGPFDAGNIPGLTKKTLLFEQKYE